MTDRQSARDCITLSLGDEQATRSLGMAIAQHCNAGSVLLLEGDLGAGKTTLVQGIGEGLGIREPIVSPTFTLIVEYLEGRVPLYHLDLYRLDPAEVSALNLETYWEGIELALGIVAIEWAERLQYRPADYLQVCLTHHNETRQAELRGVGDFDWQAIAHPIRSLLLT